jgi:hypothetical protein
MIVQAVSSSTQHHVAPRCSAGIEAVEVVPGRSEIIDEGQPFSVVVDSGGSPEHVASMLEAFRLAGARRIFTVMGSKVGGAARGVC